jgi:hypothetical protein
MPCINQTSAEFIQPGNGDPFFEQRTYLFRSGYLFSVLYKK